ncbi:MAG: hypothetical protein IJQ81_05190 [Oscillibacter sp.]|nr:hypothetical protein [Oscillibacter sp.]
MDKRYFTIRQAAREMKIPECFIRAEAKAGRVPGFKSGNRVYVDVTAFRDILSRANVRDAAQ